MSAATTGYSETQFTVAADQPFTIHFDNQDAGIPHNVAIYAGDTVSGTPVWEPGTNVFLTGPDTDDYDIPALAAGTYTFACQSHPTSMTGTLTVQ